VVSRKCGKIDEKQGIKNINSVKKNRYTGKTRRAKNEKRQTCAARIMDSGSEAGCNLARLGFGV